MAIFHGNQSQYELTMKNISRIAGFIWLGYYATLSGISAYLLLNSHHPIILLIVLILFFGPIFFRVNQEIKEWLWLYSKYRKGLKGEAAIWYELHKLPDTYEVFQHFKLPNRSDDIDFIVLGPSGIFVIEVKSHDGLIQFNGVDLIHNGINFEKNFLSQVKSQYLGLHEYLLINTNLDLFITPIIVFSNKYAKLNFGIQKIKHVHVIKKPWLLKTIYLTQWYRYAQEKNQVIMQLKKITPIKRY